MRRIVVGLIIAAVVITVGFFAYQQFQTAAPETAAPPADVNTIAVDTGLETVSAEGKVVPRNDALLAMQLGGELAEILVSEGEEVTKGQPLLRLESTDQELALKQAQAGLTQAQANVVTAEAGLLQAQTNLEAAKIGVKAAEVQLAITQAKPTEEQIALNQSRIDVANAVIVQASGSRQATVEGPTAADISAAQADLTAAEAALKAAEIRVTQVRDDSSNTSDEEKRQIELQYTAALANVEAARARLAEVQAGATAPELQAVNAGVGAAVAQRDAAEANLNLLLAGARPEQVAISEVSVEQAQQGVADAELVVLQAEKALQQAQASVAEAESAVKAAESVLRKMTLTAPFDGTVARIPVKVGQVIIPGTPVLTLADFSEWHVETTDLTELSVVTIKTGMPVEVTIDALPGVTLDGTISDISTVSDIVLGDVTYVVDIALADTADVPLRWGMTAFVNIDTAQ